MIKLMITYIEAQMGIYLKEKDLSYSDLYDIWALVQNKGCSQTLDLVTLCAFTSTW